MNYERDLLEYEENNIDPKINAIFATMQLSPEERKELKIRPGYEKLMIWGWAARSLRNMEERFGEDNEAFERSRQKIKAARACYGAYVRVTEKTG